MIENKTFANKDELFTYLKQNKDLLITQKKIAVKYADTVDFVSVVESDIDKSFAVKSESSSEQLDENTIKVKVVINTTNLLDSHGDVHIKGIWNKSCRDRKKVLLLKSHKLDFEYIISDSAEPSIKSMTWKSLGYDYEGNCQALIFDSEIKRDRNEYMFNQYRKGYVTNHSVGMQYVALNLCINSNDKYYAEEKANWDKYYKEIANKEVADERGWFWAVTEAKLIEGSAVVMGSNFATPTLSVKSNLPDYSTNEDDAESRKKEIEELEAKELKEFIQQQFKNLRS